MNDSLLGPELVVVVLLDDTRDSTPRFQRMRGGNSPSDVVKIQLNRSQSDTAMLPKHIAGCSKSRSYKIKKLVGSLHKSLHLKSKSVYYEIGPNEDQEEGCWRSFDGSVVSLTSCSLKELSVPERQALVRIALKKLQTMDLGCSISVPVDRPLIRKNWKRRLKLKAKLKSKDEDNEQRPLVFGLSLIEVIANDEFLPCLSPNCMDCKSLCSLAAPGGSPDGDGDADSGGGKSTMNPTRLATRRASDCTASVGGTSGVELTRRSGAYCLPDRQSRLVDALMLDDDDTPLARMARFRRCRRKATDSSRVPRFFTACLEYIQNKGIGILGIFRVGGSKKRIDQMKQRLNSGFPVIFDSACSPHDVAALLKDFLRELPESLLTRELYDGFLATTTIAEPGFRLTTLKLLVSLLQPANRDTLEALLTCLSLVAQHANSTTTEDGTVIPGNKMDSSNLATIIGPNILHKMKRQSSTSDRYRVDLIRPEENSIVIEVVKDLIDYSEQLFQVCSESREEILSYLYTHDYSSLVTLLDRLSWKHNSDSKHSPSLQESRTTLRRSGSKQKQDCHSPLEQHGVPVSLDSAGTSPGDNMSGPLNDMTSDNLSGVFNPSSSFPERLWSKMRKLTRPSLHEAKPRSVFVRKVSGLSNPETKSSFADSSSGPPSCGAGRLRRYESFPIGPPVGVLLPLPSHVEPERPIKDIPDPGEKLPCEVRQNILGGHRSESLRRRRPAALDAVDTQSSLESSMDSQTDLDAWKIGDWIRNCETLDWCDRETVV